jgi:hypothetical protein
VSAPAAARVAAPAAASPAEGPVVRRLRRASFAHSVLYAGLLAAWLLPGLRGPTIVLGWAHGVAWITMTALVLVACRRRVLPWSLLVLVSIVGVVLGPFAGSFGFERERRRAASASAS